MTSIVLIYTVGIAAMEDIQHGEAMNNADRAFDIVANNIDDVRRNGAPARSTELQFAGGHLAAQGQVSIELNVSHQSGSNQTLLTPISYTREQTSLHYTSGAVLRTDHGQGYVVRDPPMAFDENRTLLSIVGTQLPGATESISGSGPVQLAVRQNGPPETSPRTLTVTNASDPVAYNLSIDSPRYQAWGQYFERVVPPDSTISYDAANQTVVVQAETETLSVRWTTVDVRLSQ